MAPARKRPSITGFVMAADAGWPDEGLEVEPSSEDVPESAGSLEVVPGVPSPAEVLPRRASINARDLIKASCFLSRFSMPRPLMDYNE